MGCGLGRPSAALSKEGVITIILNYGVPYIDHYYEEAVGEEVTQESGDIGTVVRVNDQTSQPILIVSKNDKELMIPLVDEFLVEVKRKEKKLSVL